MIPFCLIQDCFGKLSLSVQFTSDNGKSENWVLLSELEVAKDEEENIIFGKFSSPLLSLTTVMRSVPSTALVKKVSVVHNCTNSCQFNMGEQQILEERELCSREGYIYQHDLSNKTYILNRFYLGESWKYIHIEK